MKKTLILLVIVLGMASCVTNRDIYTQLYLYQRALEEERYCPIEVIDNGIVTYTHEPEGYRPVDICEHFIIFKYRDKYYSIGRVPNSLNNDSITNLQEIEYNESRDQ